MTVLWNMGIKHLTHAKTKGKMEDSQYINPCVVKDAAIEASTSALAGNWFLMLHYLQSPL